jgi:hypothetical protein
MGIYALRMGKGVIIPVKLIVKEYLTEIIRISKEKNIDMESYFGEILDQIVQEQFGKNFKVSQLAHNALESRHGDMCALGDSDNSIAYTTIQKMIKEADLINNNDLPITDFGCGTLLFIGQFNDLDEVGELSYYVKLPELLYSLPAFLPQIVRDYPILMNVDCSALQEKFEQLPCIWTFTNDCHCCG